MVILLLKKREGVNQKKRLKRNRKKFQKNGVENLVVETLEPTNHIAQLYMVMNELNEEDKLRLIKEYNTHVEKYSTYTKKEKTTFIFKHSR